MIKSTIIGALSALVLVPTFAANSFPVEPRIVVRFDTATGPKAVAVARAGQTAILEDGDAMYTVTVKSRDGQLEAEVLPKDQAKNISVKEER